MSIKYTMISEEEKSLFDRRIKLGELIVLTITAIMVILSFSKEKQLLAPIALLSLNLIFVILVIIFGANKTKAETHFGSEDVDATKQDISYTLNKPDVTAFAVYAIAIFLMLCILIK